MSVKRTKSGSRVLVVLEAIASHQPIGVRALARLLDEDKSAIQRAIVTLSNEGWIRTTSEPPARWEVTARIHAVACAAQGSNDLRQRARPILERLRDETGETVMLIVPDLNNFVIADVVESRQMIRMVPHIGVQVAAQNTATGRAILPFMNSDRQAVLLGGAPDQQVLDGFESMKKCGYAISEGEINPAATNLAAPIFEFDGLPVGAIVVAGPKERLTPALYDSIGRKVVRAAQELSRAALAAPGTTTQQPPKDDES